MLILNEKNYVEELYFGRNNEVKSVVAKVGYITRYQLHALGYNDDDNYFYAVKWMTRHHDNFNENCYSKLISDAVKVLLKSESGFMSSLYALTNLCSGLRLPFTISSSQKSAMRFFTPTKHTT